MSAVEAVGVLFGLGAVYYTVKAHVLNWPIGIVNNVLFGILFFQERLYANVGLQVVYILISIYGWYEWLYGGRNRTRLPIGTGTLAGWAALAVVGAVGTGLTGYALELQGGSFPLLDALTTGLSLAAQYMQARKWIESWWVWIAGNVFYIWLFADAGNPLLVGLQFVYIALSVWGYFEWRRGLPPALAVS